MGRDEAQRVKPFAGIFDKHHTLEELVAPSHQRCADLLDALSRIIPKGIWKHDRIDGNADAHIKSAILGPSETIPIKDGKLDLGRWQSAMFAELDGPRHGRKIIVTVMGD